MKFNYLDLLENITVGFIKFDCRSNSAEVEVYNIDKKFLDGLPENIFSDRAKTLTLSNLKRTTYYINPDLLKEDLDNYFRRKGELFKKLTFTPTSKSSTKETIDSLTTFLKTKIYNKYQVDLLMVYIYPI